ncbi:hypothetical protein TorRG33x02_178070 [Trema orientale]|uniref:Uncharacterized protein n=1 Tax=Trema orientale TaxID=63057 RepID=A0A2P5ELM9_TREOI|nr:hypothetical protein TorRG33x02_178070 [Trema orientale]
MEEGDGHEIDRLISQTAELHCFDDPLELESYEEETDASTLVLAAAKLLSIKKHSVSFVKTVLAQMWGIPKGLKSNIRLIASKIGKLIEIDVKSMGSSSPATLYGLRWRYWFTNHLRLVFSRKGSEEHRDGFNSNMRGFKTFALSVEYWATTTGFAMLRKESRCRMG